MKSKDRAGVVIDGKSYLPLVPDKFNKNINEINVVIGLLKRQLKSLHFLMINNAEIELVQNNIEVFRNLFGNLEFKSKYYHKSMEWFERKNARVRGKTRKTK